MQGYPEMTESSSDSLERVAPGEKNFDLTAFVADAATFPKFPHTVYLDQENGVRLNAAIEEYDELAKRGDELKKQIAQYADGRGVGLVDDQFEALLSEREDVDQRAQALEARMDRLTAAIRTKSLTLWFRVGSANEVSNVFKDAEAEYRKRYKKDKLSGIDEQHRKSHFTAAHQVKSFCIGVVSGAVPVERDEDGQPVAPKAEDMSPAPTLEGVEALIDKLISSEVMRLFNVMNKQLDNSAEWADRVDAGFPGGGADVAAQHVDGRGAEDGAVVVRPPVAGSDW